MMRGMAASLYIAAAALSVLPGQSLGRYGGILSGGRLATGVTSIGPFFDDANEYFGRRVTRVRSATPLSFPITGSEYMIDALPRGNLLQQSGVRGRLDADSIMAAHKYYPQDGGDGFDYGVAALGAANVGVASSANAHSGYGYGDRSGLLSQFGSGRVAGWDMDGLFSGGLLQAADNPYRAALSRGSVTGKASWPLRDRFSDFGPLPAAAPGLASFGSDGYVVDDRRGVANLSCPTTGCPAVGELTPSMQAMYNRYRQYFHIGGGRPAVAPAPIPFFQSASAVRTPRSPPRVAGASSIADQRAGSMGVHRDVAAMSAGSGVAVAGTPASGARDSFFGRIYQDDNEGEGNGRIAVGGRLARNPDAPSAAVEAGKAAFARANSGAHVVGTDKIASHIGQAMGDIAGYA